MKDEIKQNIWAEKLLLSLIMYIVNHREKGNREELFTVQYKNQRALTKFAT